MLRRSHRRQTRWRGRGSQMPAFRTAPAIHGHQRAARWAYPAKDRTHDKLPLTQRQRLPLRCPRRLSIGLSSLGRPGASLFRTAIGTEPLNWCPVATRPCLGFHGGIPSGRDCTPRGPLQLKQYPSQQGVVARAFAVYLPRGPGARCRQDGNRLRRCPALTGDTYALRYVSGCSVIFERFASLRFNFLSQT